MASFYRKPSGIYYLAVTFQHKRIIRSLGTRSYETAKKLTPQIEKQILSELINGKESRRGEHLSFPALVNRYLTYNNHDWANSTLDRYKTLLGNYISNGMPDNPTTKSMTIRVINSCNNWGYKHGLIAKPVRMEGGSRWDTRNRVYTDSELRIIFDEVRDEQFNSFVRFAYYTGARRGEIRSISRENVLEGSLVVRGKTGRRYVKLNTQAQVILQQQMPLWLYKKDYVTHKFKKEVRRLGIKNAYFHDLRRTFGLNLIKQGMSIYKVSKLLGHASVRTTEQHYAPLLRLKTLNYKLKSHQKIEG